MRTVLNDDDRRSLVARARTLEASATPAWGTMTATQMVIHASAGIRMALGLLPVRDVSNPFNRGVMKHLVLLGLPIPKEVPTLPELDAVKQPPPDPSTFVHHIDELESLLSRLADADPKRPMPHGAFGPMTKKQWGRLAYLHTHHHLKQFGV